MSTDGDTSATTPDPETGAEGDTDQLTREDTLEDRGVDDLLDEGWSPPDRPSRRYGLTDYEQAHHEGLDERLAQEEPEVWEVTGPRRGHEADRAGRLGVAVGEPSGESASSLMAFDAGVAGGAASAEEAAVHIVQDETSEDLDDGDGRTDDDDDLGAEDEREGR